MRVIAEIVAACGTPAMSVGSGVMMGSFLTINRIMSCVGSAVAIL
jgi:hypothetical protein